MAKHEGYSSGHSWYYRLGGKPLFPKQIREETRASGYRGYAESDIEAADGLTEPRRSQKLRGLQARFRADLRRDLSRYRECVRLLRAYRVAHGDAPFEDIQTDLHLAVSLKHNHLVNDFAHLIWLEDLLSRQRDLFDL